MQLLCVQCLWVVFDQAFPAGTRTVNRAQSSAMLRIGHKVPAGSVDCTIAQLWGEKNVRPVVFSMKSMTIATNLNTIKTLYESPATYVNSSLVHVACSWLHQKVNKIMHIPYTPLLFFWHNLSTSDSLGLKGHWKTGNVTSTTIRPDVCLQAVSYSYGIYYSQYQQLLVRYLWTVQLKLY